MRKKQRLFTPTDLQILVGVAAGKTQVNIARELRLAQPAVSKHLGTIEKNAGIALVQRDGRRLTLTSTGHYVAESAKAVLAMLDEIETTVSGQQSDHGGFVRVVASSTPGGYAVPEAIGEFLRSAPDVKVEMNVRPLSGLWRSFESGAYDFAVVPHSQLSDRFIAQPLYDDPMVVFAHPAHPLAKSVEVTVEELSQERLIGRFGADSGYWHAVFHERSAQRPNHVELVPLEAVKRMVETGAGIGILYYSTVRREIEEGRLSRLNVVGVDLRGSFCLAHRSDLPQTAVAKRFATYMLQYFAPHARMKHAHA